MYLLNSAVDVCMLIKYLFYLSVSSSYAFTKSRMKHRMKSNIVNFMRPRNWPFSYFYVYKITNNKEVVYKHQN